MRSGGLRSAARAAARRGDWLTASHDYRALARTRAARAGDRIQLGHTLKELGDLEGALAAYADAAYRHPLHLDAQRQYGLFLRRLHQETNARNALARALALAPDAADIAAELADMDVRDATTFDRHFLLGILGGGDAKANSGPTLIHRWLAARALGRARKSARARDWPSAEHHYRDVLRHAPDLTNARVQLGHALFEQKRAEDALAAYRRALVSTPREPELYLHVGHALKALGRRDSAFEAYLTAWRLKPGFALALDEIRGLRPDMDDPFRLDGDASLADRRSGPNTSAHAGASHRLTPPPRLKGYPLSAFKYLAGSIVYKD